MNCFGGQQVCPCYLLDFNIIISFFSHVDHFEEMTWILIWEIILFQGN